MNNRRDSRLRVQHNNNMVKMIADIRNDPDSACENLRMVTVQRGAIKDFLGKSKRGLPDGDIFTNVTILYAKLGHPEHDAWEVLFILPDKRYVFATAFAPYYTGFEIRGEFQFYIADSLYNIVNFAMSKVQYDAYIENTSRVLGGFKVYGVYGRDHGQTIMPYPYSELLTVDHTYLVAYV